MQYQTLYKKSSTGAIEQWRIFVTESVQHSTAFDIVTEYGQVNGKLQTTFDTIYNGKNIGKKNETTPYEQAIAEAQAKYEKQLKKGYVTTKTAAEAGELDALIEGGIVPMLAFTFEKQGKKIKYPCYIQKKYDGTRMIAILKDGKCTLWSRTRKPIKSLPHIVAEIESIFTGDIILDGEAYSHKFKDDFEHIIHLVRQDEPDQDCTDVEFHVYDIVNRAPFSERTLLLRNCFAIGNPPFKYLVRAETYLVENEDQIPAFFESFMEQGYEGAILRNSAGLYVNKRSADLIKVKEMQDAEFRIVGIEEGRGKLAGHVGAFVCVTPENQEFRAKMMGETEKLKEYFENHELWLGRELTVKFQDYTAYGIPRFPVGLRFRESL